MTSMLGVVLTAVFLAAVAPAPERPGPCGDEATGTTSLRTGPHTARPALGHLRAGDGLTVVRASGDWYRVRLDERSRTGLRAGTEGWTERRHVGPRPCPRPRG
ncbi:SH3 domain-containing protein [Streptomyces sp. NPDC057854]|uniref:SH3 domain-containing protein n=1 Tax=unclassified Streptomyces TaxID=2593676 RepID=UPI0036B1FFB2